MPIDWLEKQNILVCVGCLPSNARTNMWYADWSESGPARCEICGTECNPGSSLSIRDLLEAYAAMKNGRGIPVDPPATLADADLPQGTAIEIPHRVVRLAWLLGFKAAERAMKSMAPVALATAEYTAADWGEIIEAAMKERIDAVE